MATISSEEVNCEGTSHLPDPFNEDLSKDILFEVMGRSNEFINFIFMPSKSIILKKSSVHFFDGELDFIEQPIMKANTFKGWNIQFI